MGNSLQPWIDQIAVASKDGRVLSIEGGASKRFYGEITQSKEVLNTHAYSGIVNYEPSELYITAKAGTPLIEIEDALKQHNQCLAFEPPHFLDARTAKDLTTVGGMVSCGLAGPSYQSNQPVVLVKSPVVALLMDFAFYCRNTSAINGLLLRTSPRPIYAPLRRSRSGPYAIAAAGLGARVMRSWCRFSRRTISRCISNRPSPDLRASCTYPSPAPPRPAWHAFHLPTSREPPPHRPLVGQSIQARPPRHHRRRR